MGLVARVTQNLEAPYPRRVSGAAFEFGAAKLGHPVLLPRYLGTTIRVELLWYLQHHKASNPTQYQHMGYACNTVM